MMERYDMTKPDFLKVGAFVKGVGFVGRIVDITESDTTIVVKVESAKAARLFQKPDLLEYTAAPQLWEPATLDDLLKDAESERQRALKSLEAVNGFVEKVVSGNGSLQTEP